MAQRTRIELLTVASQLSAVNEQSCRKNDVTCFVRGQGESKEGKKTPDEMAMGGRAAGKKRGGSGEGRRHKEILIEIELQLYYNIIVSSLL